MVKRSEKGVVSRLIRQTSCLFIEISPRSLKTEFKCHLRLSNGHRAGGDPSKRLGDERPLLNMAGTSGKVPRRARTRESAPRWKARGKPGPPPPATGRGPGGQGPSPGPGAGWEVGAGGGGNPGEGGQLYYNFLSAAPITPVCPHPQRRRERLVSFPLTSFCPLPSGVCKSELQSY